MPYLYTPPQRVEVHMIKGSLGYKETISTTVWRHLGQWFSGITPYLDFATDVDTDPATGMLLFFTHPEVVPTALQPELAAFGQGTLTLL